MKKWEYKFIDSYISGASFKSIDDMEEEINAASREGWRLLPIGLNENKGRFVLEREIPEPQTADQPMINEEILDDQRR